MSTKISWINEDNRAAAVSVANAFAKNPMALNVASDLQVRNKQGQEIAKRNEAEEGHTSSRNVQSSLSPKIAFRVFILSADSEDENATLLNLFSFLGTIASGNFIFGNDFFVSR